MIEEENRSGMPAFDLMPESVASASGHGSGSSKADDSWDRERIRRSRTTSSGRPGTTKLSYCWHANTAE